MESARSKNRSGKKGGAFIAVLLVLAALAALGFFVVVSGVPGKLLYPLEYKDELLAAAEEYGLDPCLVAAVIHTESRFRPEAVSVDGAVGLMQLLPSTAEWEARLRGIEFEESRLVEPAYNIDMGCWLLRYLTDRYEGNTRYALIAYNAGHGRLESWLASEEYTDENGSLTVIPFAETENYVNRIDKTVEEYRRLYGNELEKAD